MSIATYSLSSFIYLHTGQDSTSAFGLTSKAKQQNVVFILGKTDVSWFSTVRSEEEF